MRFSSLVLSGFVAFFYSFSPVHAQYNAGQPLPDRPVAIDGNGVNLSTGAFSYSVPVASIGDPGISGLSYVRTLTNSGWSHNFESRLYSANGALNVSALGAQEAFNWDSQQSKYVPKYPSPSTLEVVGQDYRYTAANGTVFFFKRAYGLFAPGAEQMIAQVETITRPNGEILTFSYNTEQATIPQFGSSGGYVPSSASFARLMNVESNLGWQFRYHDGETLYNAGHVYCSKTVQNCSALNQSQWPSGSSSLTQVTDANGVTTNFSFVKRPDNSTSQLSIQRVGGASVTVNFVQIYGRNRVSSIVRNGGTWQYAYSKSGSILTTTVTAPSGRKNQAKFDESNDYRMTEMKVIPSGGGTTLTTTYQYHGSGLLHRVTYPEGNKATYTYDSLGRLTQTVLSERTGFSHPDVITKAGYYNATTCTSSKNKVCLQPAWTENARGKRTDYTYSASHGGATTKTLPAPNGGARPRVTYNYATRYAWYKRSSNLISQSDPIVRMVRTRSCPSATTCTGASNEVITETIFELGSSSQPRNLLVGKVISKAGNGSSSRTTAFNQDQYGRNILINGPLSGSNDVTRIAYTIGGRLVSSVAPRGDNTRYPATTYHYASDGSLSEVKTGHATSQIGNIGFSTLLTRQTVFDSYRRPIKSILKNSSGVAQALSQTSYDNESRLVCVARRFNPGSTSGNACAQDSGGRDQISKNFYDGYGRVWRTDAGVGTPLVASTSYAFGDSGQVTSVTDAEGRTTTYEYDGHTRLKKTRFPNKTSAGSSTTDYEENTYFDTGSRAIPIRKTFRRRDGAVITYGIDGLSRITSINAPGSTLDRTLTYDLLGRNTAVTMNGAMVSNQYNVHSELTRQTTALGAVDYQYDVVGRRTRMTWPDAQYVTYHYDAANKLRTIRENGATTLATYNYDDYGRNTRLTFANGNYTNYGFDSASRLKDLDNEITNNSSVPDYRADFTYTGLGQIATKTEANSSYRETLSSVTEDLTANNLNQLLGMQGGQSYDARGNLTAKGSALYSYDIYNRLTDVDGTGSDSVLKYDPIDRLYELTETIPGEGRVTRRFLYDGTSLIAEYDTSGQLKERYVHGPGMDRPIIRYASNAMTSAMRRYIMADERGSIILETNHSASWHTIRKFGPYGEPSSSNKSRFGYTGQIFLKGARIYHYKARAYEAEIGRFLQTDPIGYGDGLNTYAYVGGDPNNYSDPTGLFGTLTCKTVGGPSSIEGGISDGGIELNGYASRQFCDFAIDPAAFVSSTVLPGIPYVPTQYSENPYLLGTTVSCAAAPERFDDERLRETQAEFDLNGPGPYGAFMRNPVRGFQVNRMGNSASKSAEREYPNFASLNGGEGDAYRHALWNFQMTQRFGASAAKFYGDAYERRGGRAAIEDLYNNRVGRELAGNYPNRDPHSTVKQAASEGCLITGNIY